MTENEITYLIRKSIYAVYNYLGPGLLENIYENLKSNKDKRMIKKLIIKVKEWIENDN